MKVAFDCSLPFMLAHGGAQIQIEQTMRALGEAGVEVEPLRWWDGKQTADILQYYGRMSPTASHLAQEKGIKVVIFDLLTAQGSRSWLRHVFHRNMIRLMTRLLPRSFTFAFGWDTYRLADACLTSTALEADLMKYLFCVRPDRVHVVPNGV